MLSHAILLLLLCASVAIDASPGRCKAFSQNVDTDCFEVSETNDAFHVGPKKCSKRNSTYSRNSLFAIIVNSQLYDSLSCNENDGWKGTITERNEILKEESIADASSTINFECIEYCAYTREGSMATATSNFNTFDYSCVFKLFIGERTLKSAACSFEKGWTDEDGKLITSDITTPLNLKCSDFSIHLGTPRSLPTTTAAAPIDAASPGRCRAVRINMDIHSPEPVVTKGADYMHFDPCGKSDKSFFAIKINSKLYKYLSCNEKDGWKGAWVVSEGREIMHKDESIADTSSVLHFECIEYCVHKTGNLIKTTKHLNVITAHCPDSTQMFIGETPVKDVFCLNYEGWIDRDAQGKGTRITADIITPWKLECRMIGQPSPRIPPTTTATAPIDPATSCTYKEMGVSSRGKKIEILHGDQKIGITVECRTILPDSMEAIVWKSIRFEFLTCNAKDGWRGTMKFPGQNGQWRSKDFPIGDATSVPQLSCVEYCVARVSGLYHEYSNPRTRMYKISCDKGHQLFHGDRYVEEASCSFEKGWWNEEGAITSDTVTPLQLECREDPNAPKTTTTTTLPPPLTAPEKKPDSSDSAVAKAELSGVSPATIAACLTGGIIFIFVIVSVVIFFMVKKRYNEDMNKVEEEDNTDECNSEIPTENEAETPSELNV